VTRDKNKLTEFLNAARLDVLPDRESRQFALRYGLPHGSPCTLEEIGKESGLSRERVRQILLRAHYRIVREAESDIKAGETGRPSARLALYIQGSIGTDSDRVVERLCDFVIGEFDDVVVTAQVVEFVSRLAYVGSERVKPDPDSAWWLIRERYSRVRRHGTIQARFEGLLGYVVWPEKTKMLTREEIAVIKDTKPPSSPHVANDYYSGKTGRSIKCSSILEKNFYRLLEHADEVTGYYAHPFEIPYEVDDRKLIYYPDLLVILRDCRAMVVETMPAFRMALWRNLVCFEAMSDYCQTTGFGFLITDGYSSLEKFRRYRVKHGYAKMVMQSLKNKGPLDWKSYKPIRDTHKATRDDFLGLVVQKKLVWHLGPFKLSMGPSGI